MKGSVEFTRDWRSHLSNLVGSRPALILVSDHVAEKIELGEALVGMIHFVPDGEKQKEWTTVMGISRLLGEMAFPRNGVIVGIGGGATTDLAGFVASIWMRGLDWVAVPTTLAAMVDAAIGGKTGINTEQGKNLVGAFHMPICTIVDQSLLRTLNQRDINAGMAEVIKCGFIADPVILDLAEKISGEGVEAIGVNPTLEEMIARSISVKSEIVSEDFTEQGRRAFLNYGHTLGHALELSSSFSLRHGEAISIGMVFAALVSQRLHGLDQSIIDRHLSLLLRYNLPVSCEGFNFVDALTVMSRDKKVKDGRIRFVTLKGLGRPELTPDVEVGLLREVFQSQIMRGG